MLLHSALADQFRQGPLYSGTGKAQIFGHGGDGVPALAILVCPVMEVHQHQLGLGAQLRVAVDLTKLAHGTVSSFFGVR